MRLSHNEKIEVMLAGFKRIRSEAQSAIATKVNDEALMKTVANYCDSIIQTG